MSGIFCLEGDWSNDLSDKSSVRPILELLDNNTGGKKSKIIHRNVGTVAELIYYSAKWRLKKYKDFPIGYFAFHGEEGALLLGSKKVSIEEIGDLLEGRCKGKIIYFGSCSVLSISEERLKQFKKVTKAKCICGYKKNVDWVMSCAFDLLLFDAFSYYKYSPANTLKYLEKIAPGLLVNLGFVMR